MSKLAVLFCYLLLVGSWPKMSSSKRLKKTRNTLEGALNLYFNDDAGKTIHDFLQNEVSSQSEGESLINSKLNQLSQDIQATKDAILFKISNQLRTKLSENIKSLFSMAADVEFVYKRYLNIYTTIKKRSVAELSDFAKTNTLHEHNLINGFERILFKMHEVLINGDDKLESTLSIINKESSQLGVICSQKESSQQLILDLYDVVVDTHIKGLQVRKFSFSFRQEHEKANFKQNIDDDWIMFQEAVNNTYSAVKSAMEVVPRTLYTCYPSQWIQGENYIQLGPVLQTHIVVSSDITGDKGRCTTKKEKHTFFSDFSRYLEVSKRCAEGYIRDCKPLGPSFEVCYSDNSTRRLYDWVKSSDNDIFGYKNVTNCSNMTMEENLRSFGYKNVTNGSNMTKEESLDSFTRNLENHCLCTCDSGRRAEDRYFSLRPVYSDYLDNKVVTGAQLIKIGRVFYIKIQQGGFGPNGIINSEPVWKDIPEILAENHWKTISEEASSTTKIEIPHTHMFTDANRKYKYDTVFRSNPYLYTVTYDTRKVHLDDLSATENEVITGFQFVEADGNLSLQIQVTPCDYEKGILHVNSTYFRGSTFQGVRQEVVLTEPEVPSASNPKAEIEISGHGHFVRFTSTDNRKDLGQNTVPFLDSQPIVTNPPMPLTGAELILKRSGFSGGFLALQLKHYNLID